MCIFVKNKYKYMDLKYTRIITIPELDDIKIVSPFNESGGMVEEFNLLMRYTDINLSYNELPIHEQEVIKQDFISKIRSKNDKYYSIIENFRNDYVIYICRGYSKKK